jgi:hypothetical protein
VEQLTILT